MMALLCVSAWDSWERLTVTSRISVVADASSNLFKAMHNLRSDRASTIRSLNDDALVQPDIGKYLRDSRDAEMPAMRAAAAVLDAVEFADQKTLVPEFDRLIQTMTALEAEVHGMRCTSPRLRAARPSPRNTRKSRDPCLRRMDKISVRLAAAVNHSDAVTDQLLMIKQVAWLLRNAAGETSLMISTGLGAGHVAPDAHQTYTKYVGRIEAAWNALETVAAGTAVAAAFR